MKRILQLALSGLVAGLGILTGVAKNADDAPSIKAILDRYVEAQGGKDAITRITNRVVTAQVEIKSAGVTLQGQFISEAPDRKLNIVDVPGMGRILEGYNGKTAWVQQPNTPATEKPTNVLADVRIDSDFYKDMRLHALYPRMDYQGRTNLNSHPAYQLQGTPKEGRVTTFYFDVENGLLTRLDTMAETPFGQAQIQIYFEDYKSVDGVKLPFTIRQPVPEIASTVITIKEVRQNVPVDETRFNKPQ